MSRQVHSRLQAFLLASFRSGQGGYSRLGRRGTREFLRRATVSRGHYSFSSTRVHLNRAAPPHRVRLVRTNGTVPNDGRSVSREVQAPHHTRQNPSVVVAWGNGSLGCLGLPDFLSAFRAVPLPRLLGLPDAPLMQSALSGGADGRGSSTLMAGQDPVGDGFTDLETSSRWEAGAGSGGTADGQGGTSQSLRRRRFVGASCGWGHSVALDADGIPWVAGRPHDYLNTLRHMRTARGTTHIARSSQWLMQIAQSTVFRRGTEHVPLLPMPRSLRGRGERSGQELDAEGAVGPGGQVYSCNGSRKLVRVACSPGALTVFLDSEGGVWTVGSNLHGECGIGSHTLNEYRLRRVKGIGPLVCEPASKALAMRARETLRRQSDAAVAKAQGIETEQEKFRNGDDCAAEGELTTPADLLVNWPTWEEKDTVLAMAEGGAVHDRDAQGAVAEAVLGALGAGRQVYGRGTVSRGIGGIGSGVGEGLIDSPSAGSRAVLGARCDEGDDEAPIDRVLRLRGESEGGASTLHASAISTEAEAVDEERQRANAARVESEERAALRLGGAVGRSDEDLVVEYEEGQDGVSGVQLPGLPTTSPLGGGSNEDKVLELRGGLVVPRGWDVTPAVQVVSGYCFGACLTAGGRVLAWGKNGRGETGCGDRDPRAYPVAVERGGLEGDVDMRSVQFVHIAAGFQHMSALDSDGRVWTWGRLQSAELADGDDGIYEMDEGDTDSDGWGVQEEVVGEEEGQQGGLQQGEGATIRVVVDAEGAILGSTGTDGVKGVHGAIQTTGGAINAVSAVQATIGSRPGHSGGKSESGSESWAEGGDEQRWRGGQDSKWVSDPGQASLSESGLHEEDLLATRPFSEDALWPRMLRLPPGDATACMVACLHSSTAVLMGRSTDGSSSSSSSSPAARGIHTLYRGSIWMQGQRGAGWDSDATRPSGDFIGDLPPSTFESGAPLVTSIAPQPLLALTWRGIEQAVAKEATRMMKSTDVLPSAVRGIRWMEGGLHHVYFGVEVTIGQESHSKTEAASTSRVITLAMRVGWKGIVEAVEPLQGLDCPSAPSLGYLFGVCLVGEREAGTGQAVGRGARLQLQLHSSAAEVEYEGAQSTNIDTAGNTAARADISSQSSITASDDWTSIGDGDADNFDPEDSDSDEELGGGADAVLDRHATVLLKSAFDCPEHEARWVQNT